MPEWQGLGLGRGWSPGWHGRKQGQVVFQGGGLSSGAKRHRSLGCWVEGRQCCGRDEAAGWCHGMGLQRWGCSTIDGGAVAEVGLQGGEDSGGVGQRVRVVGCWQGLGFG